MYKDSRKKAGLSIEEAAFRLHISPRTLSNYEDNRTIPSPEVALFMSKEYKQPLITQLYCKEYCAIGRAYSYEILNNIDLDLSGVLMSLQTEVEEAMQVLPKMVKLIRNKKYREDFSDGEWREFIIALHEWIDLEHNIECLKVVFNEFSDVTTIIQEHNEKCINKHYVDKSKTMV